MQTSTSKCEAFKLMTSYVYQLNMMDEKIPDFSMEKVCKVCISLENNHLRDDTTDDTCSANASQLKLKCNQRLQ